MGTERLQPIEEHVVPDTPPKLQSHPSCGGSQTPPDMNQLTNEGDTPPTTGGDTPPANGSDPPPTTELSSPEELALLKKLEEANRQLDADEKARHRLSPCKLNGASSRSLSSRSAGHSRTGSITSVMSNTSVSSSSLDLEAANMDDLWTVWGKIVTDWETVSKKKSGQIKDLVRKGVPHHFRGMVWQLLCDAHESPAKHKYAEYLKQNSACEKVIRRDITRTYPEHDFFREKDGLGQESLFNVMKAYSLHDREVGYCQGCGFITGLLLMQMPEEEAFAVLVRIMQEYRLRELFKPSMAELGLCMFQLECMIQEQLPDLFHHFQAQDFCVSMFASSWFLTLFTTTLPLPIACHIFDIFLSEGIEMIFRIGLAILKLAEPDLLSLDMEGMITYMQKSVMVKIEKDPEPLFTTAFQLKYNAKKMKKLEKEYSTLKTKEQEEQVELRRLRTENRLLRQRIENMEKETSTLADRLIHDQVRYARQEEEVFSLRNDLSCTRHTNEKATQKLNEARAEYEQLKETSSKAPSPEHMANTQKLVRDLQEELAEVKVREAEAECTIHELHARIREIENAKNELQREPSEELRQLQEELVACKLREAEANLSMKELRQKVTDVERHWEKYQQRYGPDATSRPGKNTVQHLAEEVMGVRLREAEAVAELKETKQRVMELETQNHIYDRQVKRLDADKIKLQEKLDEAAAHSTQLNNHIQDLDRQINKFESKMKEDSMMTRITNAEYAQSVAEMRQRIAELEIENQELVTAGQLSKTGDHQELTSRIADLQEEVMQLKMARRIQGLSQAAVSHLSFDTGSDYDTDDIEATVASSLIKLTDSMGPEDAGILLGNAVRPHLNELDSSEGEVLSGQEGRVKRRVHKKKRRSGSTKDDFDKTPTQDSINKDFHTVFKDIDSLGHVPGSDSGASSGPRENGAATGSDTANSIAGSGSGGGEGEHMTDTLDTTLTEGGVAVNGEVIGHSSTASAGH